MDEQKRYMLITCEILYREACLCVSQCRNIVDIARMPKGLHDIGDAKMSGRLQQEIDRVDCEKYNAILLCYGLCNNGIRGLHSPLPIVAPRVHDCISLLLGSKDRYREYFDQNPGVFFMSSGWIERDSNPNDMPDSVMNQLGLNHSYEEYVALYGEENAAYLSEMLDGWLKNYQKITYIDTKTGDAQSYREAAKKRAGERQWAYEELQGDTGMIFRLVNGDWSDEEFLTVPPHHVITSTGDAALLAYMPR